MVDATMKEQPGILAQANGVNLAYRRHAGAGPGVVFVHGFRSDMNGTKAQELEGFCRMRGRAFVCFDLSGHGASGGDFAKGSIGGWTQDLLAVLDSLTEGPQILVGSSLGAWLVLLAALARPQRVAGLMGLAGAPDFTEDMIWPDLSSADKAELERKGHMFLPSDYSDEPYLLTWHLIEEAREHLLLRRPIGITCPVRLIHGMKDRDVPWQTSLRLTQMLMAADVALTLVKDGDHRLSRAPDLALISRELEALLEQVSE